MNMARILPGVAIFLCVSSPFALADVIQRVSVNSAGDAGTSFYPLEITGVEEWSMISADGRFVIFSSWATDLVPGDTNGTRDVFLRDRVTNTTLRVSLGSTGEQGNSASGGGDISPDGRYVLFGSSATNLVAGDTNERADLFVRDRLLGTTDRVNVSTAGQQANGGHLSGASISADFRYVAFSDEATNLVPGDTNGYADIFVRDRVAGTTERVSVSSSGGQANFNSFGVSISADGRYVAFSSWASNLVPGGKWEQIYLRDRTAATTGWISMNMWGEACGRNGGPSISADGRYVMFTAYCDDIVPGDTNGWKDVFLRDRLLATTERLSVSSTGEQGTRPEGAMGVRYAWAGISADARYVVFESNLDGLVPGDYPDGTYNVFMRDRLAGTTEMVSVSMNGDASLGICPSISADGRCIAFNSWAADLVPGDTDDYSDIFVRDLDARFHDVPSCYWAFPHIEGCVSADIVTGYDDNTYLPKYAVNRAQMAVYIARALAGGDENVPDGPSEPSFPDVPDSGYGSGGDDPHWAYKYVEYAVQQNVVTGYGGGDYRPEETVNRGQMAVYIARALVAPAGEGGVPVGPAEPTFPDVTRGGEWEWGYDHVEYIAAEGVAAGYRDGKYHPEYDCARDQMSVYIARAFDLAM